MVVYLGTNIDGVDAISDLITLDRPQLFLGTGQVALLGESCETLYFSNDGTADANVRIIAARAAEQIQQG